MPIIIATGVHIPQILFDYVLRAEKRLLVGAYIIKDEDLLDILYDKSAKLPVKVVVDANPENRRAYTYYRRAKRERRSFQLRVYPYGMYHVKALVSDGRAYVGTMNFSFSGMYTNAEVGVFMEDAELANIVAEIISADFEKSKPPKSAKVFS